MTWILLATLLLQPSVEEASPAQLRAAITAGRVEPLRAYLEAGGNPHVIHERKPLWVTAALDGQFEITQLFLDAGVDYSALLHNLSRAESKKVLGVLHRLETDSDLVNALARELTMMEFRIMAGALQDHRKAHGHFPDSNGAREKSEFLLTFFPPKPFWTIPLTDGWGNAYEYSSDGQEFLLMSGGADGAVDEPDVLTDNPHNKDILFGPSGPIGHKDE